MELEEDDDGRTQLLKDSEGNGEEPKLKKVIKPPTVVPVVRKNYVDNPISTKRHHLDLPYSTEEKLASESIRFPERRISHFPQRPQKRKWFTRFRWTLGILMLVCLIAMAAGGIYLIFSSKSTSNPWWTSAIVYQCYPQSFQDSNEDGLGDLKGIRNRVSHFTDIGVQAVWLNPIFQSPQKDNGYDISNYTAIYEKYGTIDEFKLLLNDLHAQGIRLLLDFVPNHTSDQHPWFKESRSSKNNSKRDWYIWADGNGKSPPNNWISVFGGSAWTYDNSTDQWFFHQFSSFQPDLNYRNEEVRKEMINVLRYWLDMGVDGFRVDAIAFLLEDSKLRNETRSPGFNSTKCLPGNVTNRDCYNSLVHNLTTNYPGIHNITREWKQVIDEYSEDDHSAKLFIGEIYDNIATVMSYYGTNGNEFNFPFNFFLLDNMNWTGNAVSCIVANWLNNMPSTGTPNWVLGNHDNPRIASKAGVFLARALNVLLLTLPGTVTTYYGEEIMMTDVYVPPNEQKDKYDQRDAERTPMQWNSSTHAGFTSSKSTPWLPLATNYSTVNVEAQSADVNKTSMLHLYKSLSALRNSRKAFTEGNYTCINATEDVLMFARHSNSFNDIFLIVINFSPANTTANVSLELSNAEIMLSSYLDTHEKIDLKKPLNLRSGEGLVIMGTQTSSTRRKIEAYGSTSKCNFCTATTNNEASA